jgi:hypothetical protein
MISRRSFLLSPLALAEWERCDLGSPVVKRLIPNVICVGESLTSGTQSTGGEGSVNSYPGRLANARQQTYGTTVMNLGIGGIGIDSLCEPECWLVANRPNVLVVMEGINDFFNAGSSAASIFTKLQTYINARVAAGWRVVVCTLTKVGLSNPSAQTQRTSYNSSIRSTYTGGAVAGVTLCDVANNANIGDAGNTGGAYFSVDGYHLSDTGYLELANVVNAVLPATWQTSPTIATASGAALLSSSRLTGWFRPDWSQRNTSVADMFTIHNLAARQCFLRYLVENNQSAGGGHVQVSRVDASLNGKSVARFPGNQSAGSDKTAYMQSSTTLASIVSASSFFYAAIINPTAIQSTNVNPHFNDIIIGCSGGFGCGLGLRDSGGTLQVIAYTDDGAKKVAATTLTGGVGNNVAVFARLTGGNVGVRLGTQGSWVQTASGNIGDLTGAMKMGASSLDCFKGDLADALMFNSYDASDDSAVGAYIRARYGSSL